MSAAETGLPSPEEHMPVAPVRDDPLHELIATETAVQEVLARARLRAEGIIRGARESAARREAELDTRLNATLASRSAALEQELQESLAALEAETARSIDHLLALDDDALDQLADLVIQAVVPREEAGIR
jgi:vacuolar-type H+-ATPase subunit H